jgi:hypothetical protein
VNEDKQKKVRKVGRSEQNGGFILHGTPGMELHIFIEWAAVAEMLYICIEETCGLNIGWAINYPARDFWWFSSLTPGKCQCVTSIKT